MASSSFQFLPTTPVKSPSPRNCNCPSSSRTQPSGSLLLFPPPRHLNNILYTQVYPYSPLHLHSGPLHQLIDPFFSSNDTDFLSCPFPSSLHLIIFLHMLTGILISPFLPQPPIKSPSPSVYPSLSSITAPSRILGILFLFFNTPQLWLWLRWMVNYSHNCPNGAFVKPAWRLNLVPL